MKSNIFNVKETLKELAKSRIIINLVRMGKTTEEAQIEADEIINNTPKLKPQNKKN